MEQGPVTSGEDIRNERAIPALAIIQGVAAIGGMMIKGINTLVDAKRASSFNNAIKLVNENVQITHDRLITLESRTAMMAKAIIAVLKDFKQQINNTNDRLTRQYRMMTRAHERYNRLFRQTHKTFQIHHLTLLMVKDYITILVGTLQRIHRHYIRYESALDNTLIGIEHLNSGYLTHHILDPKMSRRTDLFVEMTNVTKDNGIWAHFVSTGYFPSQIQLSRLIQKDDVQIETVCGIFKWIRINWSSSNVTGISGTMITMPDTAYVSIFMDNDLTHITEDHFEITLIARLLDQMHVVQPPMFSPRYDDAPPSAPQFAEHLHSLLTCS